MDDYDYEDDKRSVEERTEGFKSILAKVVRYSSMLPPHEREEYITYCVEQLRSMFCTHYVGELKDYHLKAVADALTCEIVPRCTLETYLPGSYIHGLNNAGEIIIRRVSLSYDSYTDDPIRIDVRAIISSDIVVHILEGDLVCIRVRDGQVSTLGVEGTCPTDHVLYMSETDQLQFYRLYKNSLTHYKYDSDSESITVIDTISVNYKSGTPRVYSMTLTLARTLYVRVDGGVILMRRNDFTYPFTYDEESTVSVTGVSPIASRNNLMYVIDYVRVGKYRIQSMMCYEQNILITSIPIADENTSCNSMLISSQEFALLSEDGLRKFKIQSAVLQEDIDSQQRIADELKKAVVDVIEESKNYEPLSQEKYIRDETERLLGTKYKTCSTSEIVYLVEEVISKIQICRPLVSRRTSTAVIARDESLFCYEFSPSYNTMSRRIVYDESTVSEYIDTATGVGADKCFSENISDSVVASSAIVVSVLQTVDKQSLACFDTSQGTSGKIVYLGLEIPRRTTTHLCMSREDPRCFYTLSTNMLSKYRYSDGEVVLISTHPLIGVSDVSSADISEDGTLYVRTLVNSVPYVKIMSESEGTYVVDGSLEVEHGSVISYYDSCLYMICSREDEDFLMIYNRSGFIRSIPISNLGVSIRGVQSFLVTRNEFAVCSGTTWSKHSIPVYEA